MNKTRYRTQFLLKLGVMMQKKGITAKEHIIISLYVREKDPHEEACSKAT